MPDHRIYTHLSDQDQSPEAPLPNLFDRPQAQQQLTSTVSWESQLKHWHESRRFETLPFQVGRSVCLVRGTEQLPAGPYHTSKPEIYHYG
jgi:hypothetical protein